MLYLISAAISLPKVCIMLKLNPEAVQRLSKRCVNDLTSREACKLARSFVEPVTYEPNLSCLEMSASVHQGNRL